MPLPGIAADGQFRRDISQETRWCAHARFPIECPAEGVDQINAILGPGQPHVKKTTLFGQLFHIVQRAAVWQDSFLQACNKYNRKLQPLGGVQGQERGSVLRLVQVILLRDQCDLLQKLI